MKKIGLLFVTLIMMFLFVFSVSAANRLDLSFELNDDGSYYVSDCYDLAKGELIIPSTIYSRPVTAIGFEAFYECRKLSSITIPNGVTDIKGDAFECCTGLSSITIPDSVTYIGSGAFDRCISLKSVTIPDGVISINSHTFYNCQKLTSVTIPDSVTTILYRAFYSCISLRNIIIPDSVTYIDEGAFGGCINLENAHYCGTQEKWDKVHIDSVGNSDLKDAVHMSTDKDNDGACDSCSFIIPEHEHSYISNTQKPTCTNKGYTNYLCTRCGAEYTDEVAATGHSYNAETTAPTCTDPGYTTYTCSCNDSYVSDYVKATGHSYTPSVTKEPTVTEEGIRTFTCSDCGASYTEALPVTVAVDEETSIAAEYSFGTFEKAPKMIVVKGGTNANFAFGGLFGRYAAFDIFFEIDGKKVQPDGKVTVRIPIISGYNIFTTAIYYLDDNGNKTKIESRYKDGYIVFETDHFSEYVLVDESSEFADCSCNCHKIGFGGFIYKILRLFWKLFKTNQFCKCGVTHY